MSKQRLSGVLLIIGFGFVVVSSLIGPPGLYQEPNLDARLEIISVNPGNWFATNGVFALAILITAAGLLIFSTNLRDTNIGWVGLVANAAIILGSVSFVVHIGLRQFLPAENLERITLFSMGGFWLILVALLAFGMVFLRVKFPRWFAALFVGIPILLAILASILGYRFYFNFPPQTFYLLTLIAGMVFLRRERAPRRINLQPPSSPLG